MKKSKNVWVLLAVLLCTAATAAYAFVFVLWDDRTPPVITMDVEVLEVSVSADDNALKSGVTARDNVDGDVTDSILIEGITGLNSSREATITYAAFDSSGNVARQSRTVKYTDYTSPLFGQKGSLTFSASASANILNSMTAVDVLDGDISDRIKATLVSETGGLGYTGLHMVEFRVTNSMGDTQYITLPVEVYENGAYNATVELTDYLIYLKPGEKFDPKEYLDSMSVGSSNYSLTRNTANTRVYVNSHATPSDSDVRAIYVDIESSVDTSVPGVYSVLYKAKYEDMYTGCARLNVVVEE